MTRFMITLEQGVDLVWHAFKDMVGGEIYEKNTVNASGRYGLYHRPKQAHTHSGIRPAEKFTSK